MTLEELDTATATEVAAKKPLTWNTMGSALMEGFIANMVTDSKFSPEQMAYRDKWWLVFPNAQTAEQVNEALPSNTRITPVLTTGGELVCNIDVLTDADTFGKAASILKTLKVRQLTPADFPQEEII